MRNDEDPAVVNRLLVMEEAKANAVRVFRMKRANDQAAELREMDAQIGRTELAQRLDHERVVLQLSLAARKEMDQQSAQLFAIKRAKDRSFQARLTDARKGTKEYFNSRNSVRKELERDALQRMRAAELDAKKRQLEQRKNTTYAYRQGVREILNDNFEKVLGVFFCWEGN